MTVMAYYGSNTGAKLYIGTSILAVLPLPAADAFTELPLLGSVQSPTNELQGTSFVVQNDTNRRRLGGKLADQTVDANIVLDWASAVHLSVFADSTLAGGQKRNWRIDYPTGRRMDFVAYVGKWTEEPLDASEEAKEHRADFTLMIDGAITVTP
jgi:hypothetical protein